MNMEEKFYSAKEISKLFSVAYMTVYRWIRAGRLKAYQAGKQYRVKKEDLDNFLKVYKHH